MIPPLLFFSGGLYYWAAALSRPKYKPVLSFFTGWFNLIGQLAGTAAVAFGLALVVVATISIGTDQTWVPTPGATVGVYIAILFIVGLLNTFANNSLGFMNVVSSKYPFSARIHFTIAVDLKSLSLSSSVLASYWRLDYCHCFACSHSRLTCICQICVH